MNDHLKSKPELIKELESLRKLLAEETPSERKQAEEALLESEKRLDLFFDQSLDGFFFMMLDEPIEWNAAINKEEALDYVFAHQRVTKVNDAMLAQYLATREEFMDLTPNDFFVHDIQSGKKVWREFFDSGQLHIETNERRFDGSEMFVEGDYICLYDSDKRITGHFGIQRDITERKLVEEMLKHSEEKYRSILDNTQNAIFIKDLDGKYLFINKTFENLHGIKNENIMGLTDYDIFPKELANKFRENDLTVIKNNKPTNLEESVPVDGKILTVISTKFLLYDENDDKYATCGIATDITERKQADDALQKSEEKYRTLSLMKNAILESPEGIIVFALDKNYCYLDFTSLHQQTMEMIWGVTIDLGDNMLECIKNTADREKAQMNFDRALQGERFIVEEEYGDTELKRTFYEDRYGPVFDENGDIIGVSVFVIDSTDRKQAEENITQQSIQRQRLLEMGRQLTSSLDIDNVLNYISAEVRTLLGASGVTIYMLDGQGKELIPVLTYPPDYSEQVISANLDVDNSLTGQVIKVKQGLIFNYADQQPDGYHIPGTPIDEEHLIIAPFIINGKAIGSLNVYRSSATFDEDDLALAETFTMYASTAINNARNHQEVLDQIAERKKAEQALAQSDSLRELLLDIITHDLKNPAGVIYSMSEAARKDIPENKFLEGIYTSSGRLLNVLDNTTTLAQATFGEDIPMEELSLNSMLTAIIDEFSNHWTENDMDLSMEIPPDTMIIANPLIAEVFKNYISNAIKYAGDGKRIEIETIIEDQAVTVCVKDFGKTIQEADRLRVFDRAVQLDSNNKRGRGLGLAIVKRIAEAHEGEAWVEPNTPQGNSFCLRIPR